VPCLHAVGWYIGPALQIRWKDYVPVAWAVDPALALSLQDHFPSNADVKHALEQLVVESAHKAKVCGTGAVLSSACRMEPAGSRACWSLLRLHAAARADHRRCIAATVFAYAWLVAA
jgi:hypothetical protein